MRYVAVHDFGTKVEFEDGQNWWEALGYESYEEVLEANGGTEPDVDEITKDDYDDESDGYDCA